MAKKKPAKTETGQTIRLKDGRKIQLPAGEAMDFCGQLRDTIRAAGLTQYYLAKLTGIPQSAISQFMNGRDLRVETFQKLCHVVGLELNQNPDKAPRTLDSDI